jgi:hypothetical protein
MLIQAFTKSLEVRSCTDPIIGAILSASRYDIASISPEKRSDCENHLDACVNCRRCQRMARTIDVILVSISSLSIAGFLLMFIVMRRLEALTHIAASLTLHLRDTPIVVSLQAVVIGCLFLSMLLWVLIVIATPLLTLIKNFPSGPHEPPGPTTPAALINI